MTQIGYLRKNFIKIFFKLKINNLNDIKIKLWDTQKNIEEDEKSAQKKDEQEEEIKRDSLI